MTLQKTREDELKEKDWKIDILGKLKEQAVKENLNLDVTRKEIVDIDRTIHYIQYGIERGISEGKAQAIKEVIKKWDNVSPRSADDIINFTMWLSGKQKLKETERRRMCPNF